eukprot:m.82674 g.82674  ORF g.82674 m.82674 type:complete len:357 (+) comp14929_c0_seq2:104-1174(+)
MRRLTRKEKIQEEVKKLDAFPKVEPEVQVKTPSGALATIIVATMISVLVFSEFYYYRTIDTVYEYTVDTDLIRNMSFHIDCTVKMHCEHLGVDYIDISGTSTDATRFLELQPAHFDLAPNQLEWLERAGKKKDERGSYSLDSLERFMHLEGVGAIPDPDPAHTTPPDSCRIHGSMPINKIAANFHITAGKSIHHARGHAHMSNSVPREALNFSHRIDSFSFADERDGMHTLDGDLRVTEEKDMMYQYFLKVVPSTIQVIGQKKPTRTNQYSVTEQHRNVGANMNRQGVPGIFVKYDFEAVSVGVREQRRSFAQFLVRMCGIVGGIFVTSGLLHSVISAALAHFTSNKDATPLPSKQ